MKNTPSLMSKIVRWTAWLISLVAAGFWLLILLDIIACDALVGFVCLNWEVAILAGLVAGCILSVILTWWRQAIGGTIMLLWGLFFTLFAYATGEMHPVYSMLVSGVPFLIAGLLFIISARLARPSPGA